MNIRPTQPNDIPDLQVILDETELFPGEMLPELINSFLTSDQCEEVWLTCEFNQSVLGFCYAAPEPLTEGTWNMLAIAVSPSQQGTGIGAALVKQLENNLRRRGHRVLIADTSGTPAYAQTRDFYRKTGYTEEANIRDFWADGDDKVTFWKRLQS